MGWDRSYFSVHGTLSLLVFARPFSYFINFCFLDYVIPVTEAKLDYRSIFIRGMNDGFVLAALVQI